MARRAEGCTVLVFLFAIALAIIIIRNIREGERALREESERAVDAFSKAGSRLSSGLAQ